MVGVQVERGQEKGSVLRALAAHFRLLRVCEYTLNGNLEGIDALLGRSCLHTSVYLLVHTLYVCTVYT